MKHGFFAGGGIEYFGRSVRLMPEDVYYYGFAVPRTMTVDEFIETLSRMIADNQEAVLQDPAGVKQLKQDTVYP